MDSDRSQRLTPAANNEWALVLGSYVILDDAVAGRVLEILRARDDELERDHLPHRDTVPEEAHWALVNAEREKYRGWKLYNRSDRTSTPIPPTYAQKIDSFLSNEVVVTDTRRGRNKRARLVDLGATR